MKLRYMLSDPFGDQNWAKNFLEVIGSHSNALTGLLSRCCSFVVLSPKLLGSSINGAPETVLL